MKSSRVTMRQVAAEAGVAVMTVSYSYTRPDRVAAPTRAKVLEAAERLGYRGPDPVARSLRSGSTGNLGVVLGEHLAYAFEDPQAARFLTGVSRVCAENRLGLVLIPTTGEPDDIERVREAAVDGFVLWTTVDDDPVLDVVAATGRPAAIQGGPAVPGVHVVAADDHAAARAIARHMLIGARSPLVLSHPLDRDRVAGLLWGPSTDVPFPVTRARLTGYREAVEQSGRAWADVPVAVVARHTRDDGRQAVAAVLDAVRPDAVIAMSDQLAAGALDTLGASARVSGWDDSDLATALRFPSVRQSLFDQGVACARIAAGLNATADAVPWTLALHEQQQSSPADWRDQ
ncbi:LacI family DNA-binding transcriptional regulator [Microbacterium maritypicum]|uniref:LacI family transcriptional regulator n=1 Tax=Microbacterium maritypicum TaxID=33918 RepID=A0A4Y4BCA7_MICMQ|nr:LacI family DNA-binding transcriptional regulator [Microbacterium liquefaciens]GEC76810.1 LacI family transcriptional regulator [Microbacterium liquefaciens]GGV64141.1 LacI family transcriptional regulator [Microbacterium liquefaciens]